MIPYFIILLSVLVIAYVGRIANSRLMRWLSLGLVFFILTGFAGLRDRSVGTDTGNYVRLFFFPAEGASYITRSTEVGYNFLAWTARGLSDSYATLLILIAVIVVGCYLSTITKLVRRYEVGLFIFICLGTYTFFFNGARQGIAAAVCFTALPFLLERKALPYFLAVGIAALFHHSALVALPLYFLAAPRISGSRLLLLAVATVACVAFLQLFVQLAAELVRDKYAGFAEQGKGGGEVFSAFLLSQGAAFFLVRNKIGALRDEYISLLNIYLIGLIPVVTSVVSDVNPSGILRFHLYFSPIAILLWPMVFHQVKNHRERALIGFGFLVLMTVFFILTTSAFSDLTPYRINQELWMM